ncbi:carbamate kinase [Lachnospiraceae bacterium LCP25S3_G4]
MKKKVVVALGHRALGTTLPEQMVAVKNSAKSIADLIEEGYQVVISHSNAPQVGMIHTAMNEFGKTHEDYTPAPMSVCSAMSQGYIGYDLQNAIREELLSRGIFRTVSTVLTQVLVDPYDEAFSNPTKTVGRYMSKEEALQEEAKGNYVVEEPQKGYRRIVAAPKPIDIIEIDAIKALLDANQVVIACGGGGIPVLEQGHHLRGASAVIEKDLASGKLAELINADELIILTSVEKVSLNHGHSNETELGEITLEDAKKYIAEKHFEEHTMLPKIEASVSFIEKRSNRTALITSFDKLAEGIKGKTGTIIKA